MRDAAVLLLSLGEQAAADVLKHLGPKDIQRIGAAMSAVGQVTVTQVSGTLSSFFNEVQNQAAVGIGSDDYIRNTLTRALGEDKAAGLIDKILFGRSTKGLEMLKWMEPREVADHLRNEHPQTIAVVLAYLDSEQSAGILGRMSEPIRAEVLARIATLDGVQPSALNRLDELIERQFSGKDSTRTTSIGGPKAAADILNNMEPGQENLLLGHLRKSDVALATVIEDLIFTFDDLTEIEDRDFQSLLREVTQDLLVPALKAADEAVRAKFFKNMSQRAGEMLRDDLESRGPIKISEAEAAQREILNTARKLAEAGTISLTTNADGYV
ncbi:MAG TPA: flagellar motor switch protein FliG [Steroidobacteraceae bacterium]|nr:flagellar motor switch protein FliG [Steroidobacteraceae bacterium]